MNAQAVYDSPLLNLGLAAASAAVVFLMAARRMKFLPAWTVIFAADIALDAYLTGSVSPLPGRLIGAVAVPFVFAGDLRFFLLAERFSRAPDPVARTPRATVPSALAWSVVVPAIAFTFRHFAPAGTPLRWVFLVYEALFLLLGGFYVLRYLPRRMRSDAHQRVRGWVLNAGRFALAIYVLWALSDALILGGVPSALWLRIVPNVLYYAAFVPFVWRTAPYETRS